VTEPGDGAVSGAELDSGIPLEGVRELLVTLGKALRAAQLYDTNNPVYKRFVEALGTSFTGIWNATDTLTLSVDEDQITTGGAEVYRNTNRSESLAFLLYKDGVRRVTFQPGFEKGVPEFLDVLNAARHARQEDADLLTLLWEADLDNFSYRYVDLLAEGVTLPEAGEGMEAGEMQEVLQDAQAEEDASGEAGGDPPPAPVSADDFNPTLYALDPAEMTSLREEIANEGRRDIRSHVLDALFDRMEENNPKRRAEIFEILTGLLPAFLARGEMTAATKVLRELRTLEEREVFGVEGQKQLTALLDRVSSPATINELVDALEVGALDPSAEELGTFLSFLRARALGTLLRASETLESRDLQRVLTEAVTQIAASNPEAVVQLLHSNDPVVIAAAARIVGRNAIPGAEDSLRELVFHEESEVRHAAVEAAGLLRSGALAGALVETLLDVDAEVRIAGARALGQLRYRPAASRFREVIDSKEIRQAERTEKIAVFEAYGLIGDPEAEEVLDKMLNGKGFLGRREAPELRACAALALGKVGTPGAKASLERARNEEDPVIRTAVSRALRGDAGGEE